LTRTPLGLIGSLIATTAGLLLLTLLGISLVGFEGGPYFGLLAFMLLPAIFVGGLLLIPIGAWLERRRLAYGGPPSLPIIDLNDLTVRRKVLVVAGLTVLNVVIVAVATYRGVHEMESPAFCGSCHSVMDPEFSAYSRSPHQRVRCVECHIGPGASWFVKSKLSGSWQLVSVVLGLYPTPIPTPVENLRPARDTCEQCHWPSKVVGDRLTVVTHHADDEASTPKKTVLVLRVGGLSAGGGQGIHHHVSPGVEVRYLADAKRETIGTVEVKRADGSRLTYLPKAGPTAAGPGVSWRTMDCIDCHNRPTHQFRSAEWELDQALEAGRIDRTLPFIRREALKALTASYASAAEAKAGLTAALVGFYGRERPEVLASRRPAIEGAAGLLAEAWARNVWPQMKIGWGTYPSLLGHVATTGCFRCHDEEHATAGKATLSQDCGLCHTLLADGEEDPAILKQLTP
jgi:nitrate/TMAO reductase-like tetraheme cytochrome c subunit